MFICSRRFALRGNVIDLAIGIVIGSVFINVVQSLVDDIITPPLGLLLGGVDFANLTIKMKNFVYEKQPPVVIRYGKFLQALIAFVIMAMTLFLVIKGINRINRIATVSEKDKDKPDVQLDLDVSEEVKVLCEIRDLLVKHNK
jgi:large conductance mechanosensitive channel